MQIAHQRLADIDRHREPILPPALAVDQSLAGMPIEIVQPQRSDLAGTQPQTHHQEQDRVVAPTDRPPPIAASQQPRDDRWLQPARQRAISQIGNPGHRPPQRQPDQPHDVQVAQQRAQLGDQVPGAGHAALRTLARQEPAHIGRAQALELEPAGMLALFQEQPGDVLVLIDRALRQPALAHQVLAIGRKQPLNLASRRGRHRRRRHAALAQERQR